MQLLTVPGEAGMGGRGSAGCHRGGVSPKSARWGREQQCLLRESVSSRLTGKPPNIWFLYFLSTFIVLEKEMKTFFSISIPKWFLKQNQLLKENNLFYLYQKKKRDIRHPLWSKLEIQRHLSAQLSRHSSGNQLLIYPSSLLQLG